MGKWGIIHCFLTVMLLTKNFGGIIIIMNSVAVLSGHPYERLK